MSTPRLKQHGGFWSCVWHGMDHAGWGRSPEEAYWHCMGYSREEAKIKAWPAESARYMRGLARWIRDDLRST